MTEIFSLLENPLIQLLLIAGSVMGLGWLSERQEQRRVATGLPRRNLRERLLEGLGLVRKPPQIPDKSVEDVWVTAARELELPVDKVLQLKERVLKSDVKPPRSKPAKIHQ